MKHKNITGADALHEMVYFNTVDPTSTLGASRYWYDTTASILKLRNAANSAWITISAGTGYYDSVAVSDEDTAIAIKTAAAIFHVQVPFTLTSVMAGLSTVSGGGTLVTVNIKKNGSTIFSTQLTIDNGEKTSLTAVTAYVLTGTISFIAGDEIQIDIVQAGSGAKGLKIYFNGAL